MPGNAPLSARLIAERVLDDRLLNPDGDLVRLARELGKANSAQRWLNVWKILRSIDRVELERGWRPISQEDWNAFMTDPPRFLLFAEDEMRDRIWSVVQERLG